ELLHREIKHSQLAITAAEQVHRFHTGIWILSRALQFRHGVTKMPCTHEMFTKFKSKLQVGWVPLQTLARVIEQNFCPLLFRDLQFNSLFRMQLMIGSVPGEKFFVRSNLALDALDFQIRDFSNESAIGPFCQTGGMLIPANSCLEVFLLLV